ncbi:MAG: hypothetical protein M5R40_04275 [Anaerolineae bacterium]|nr:hypothetical protein [Anaerolineae bacterium]
MQKRRVVPVISLILIAFAVACTPAQSAEPTAPPSATPDPASTGGAFSLGGTTTLDGQAVAPGEGAVSLDIAIPEGWHINTDAPPFTAAWKVDGKVAQIVAGDQEVTLVDPVFPVSVPVTFTPGETEVSVDVVLYYCNDDQTICTLDRRTVVAPLTVTDAADSSRLTVAYAIVPPEMP